MCVTAEKLSLEAELDLEIIKHIVETTIKKDIDILYLEAEICRDDLLVEIEAVAIEH